jgi:hypothetical protein
MAANHAQPTALAVARVFGLRLRSGMFHFNVHADLGILDRFTVSQQCRSKHHETDRICPKLPQACCRQWLTGYHEEDVSS